jgi:hypothetical protein
VRLVGGSCRRTRHVVIAFAADCPFAQIVVC